MSLWTECVDFVLVLEGGDVILGLEGFEVKLFDSLFHLRNALLGALLLTAAFIDLCLV